MRKQTAVEWLHEIAKQREPDKFDWEQAKEMEKTPMTFVPDEKMYSEEDLRNAYRWGTTVNHGTKEHFKEWFEQFKKK